MTPGIEGLGRIIGHRGAAGYAPENTLASVRRAAALGVHWVEVDAKLSAGGHAILMHDDTLERTTNGRGPVSEASLADLAGFDAGGWFGPEFAGERVPSLDQFLDACTELGLRANIEIKPGPGEDAETAHAVAAVLAARNFADAALPLVSSASLRALDAFLETANEFPCGAIFFGPVPDDAVLVELKGRAVSIHAAASSTTKADVERAKAHGFAVLVFTVNDPDDAARFFGWGVDALFSDYPDRLMETR